MFSHVEPNTSLMDKFIYELDMFNGVFSLAMGRTNNSFEKNAGIESFLIHARNLIDFLSDKVIHDDDLTCSDFSNERGEIIPAIQLPPECKNLTQKINKHLSHLTKKRVEEKLTWHLGEIKSALNTASIVFLTNCNQKYFSDKRVIIAKFDQL